MRRWRHDLEPRQHALGHKLPTAPLRAHVPRHDGQDPVYEGVGPEEDDEHEEARPGQEYAASPKIKAAIPPQSSAHQLPAIIGSVGRGGV
jgi:hypothetical protein